MAGESIHFYEEVLELGELPTDDSVRRIYMARHIIQKYIVAGDSETFSDDLPEKYIRLLIVYTYLIYIRLVRISLKMLICY